jgi:N-acetylmuramoyl-L-alanine amidase
MNVIYDWIVRNVDRELTLSPEDLERLSHPPNPSVYDEIETVRKIVVHHSGTLTGCAAVFRALHRGVFGWDDIGYHYVIGNGSLSGDGEVEEGRPKWAVGAHARENNLDSIGLCLVGNMNLYEPTEAQLVSLIHLLSSLLSEYLLPVTSIRLHRDLPPCVTECPGSHINLSLIRKLLRRRR